MLLLLAGCAAPLRERASNEFNCPADMIDVTDIGGGGFRAEGCGKMVTFVCKDRRQHECTRQGVFGGAAGERPDLSPNEANSHGPIVPLTNDWVRAVDHDGFRFEMPHGFQRDMQARGEVYRDSGSHHAVRITVFANSGTAEAWVSQQYPDAEATLETIAGRNALVATRVGKALRASFAIVADGRRVYELACSVDDVTGDEPDDTCRKVFASFRVSASPPAATSPTTTGTPI